MVNLRHGLPTALLASVLALAAVQAAEPDAVGMVINITGETSPNLPVRTEIPANTAIKLGPQVELTFLHYRKCKLVTVAGGTVQLSASNFTTDGKVEREEPGPCPRVYQLGGGPGGWVSRGLPPRLPVDSQIIFAGRRADRVTEAAVYSDDHSDRPLFRFELVNRRAAEPTDTEPLTVDHRYVLRVRMNDQPEPIEHSFVAIAPGAHGSLVVLRID
jgi:hypothetical protein